MRTPNVLLLSLAIAAALSACSGDKTPAATPDAQKAPADAPKAELPPLAAFNVGDLDTSKNACNPRRLTLSKKKLDTPPSCDN